MYFLSVHKILGYISFWTVHLFLYLLYYVYLAVCKPEKEEFVLLIEKCLFLSYRHLLKQTDSITSQ